MSLFSKEVPMKLFSMKFSIHILAVVCIFTGDQLYCAARERGVTVDGLSREVRTVALLWDIPGRLLIAPPGTTVNDVLNGVFSGIDVAGVRAQACATGVCAIDIGAGAEVSAVAGAGSMPSAGVVAAAGVSAGLKSVAVAVPRSVYFSCLEDPSEAVIRSMASSPEELQKLLKELIDESERSSGMVSSIDYALRHFYSPNAGPDEIQVIPQKILTHYLNELQRYCVWMLAISSAVSVGSTHVDLSEFEKARQEVAQADAALTAGFTEVLNACAPGLGGRQRLFAALYSMGLKGKSKSRRFEDLPNIFLLLYTTTDTAIIDRAIIIGLLPELTQWLKKHSERAEIAKKILQKKRLASVA